MLRYQIRALRKILQKPVALCSTSVLSKLGQSAEERKSSFIQQISEEFGDSKEVILRLKNDSLLNINFDAWKSRISIMNIYGFSNAECFEMIFKYPALLEIPSSELKETVAYWHQAISQSKLFHLLLISQPEFLEVHEEVIKYRIPKLRLYFNNPGALVSILISCPNVMFEKWELVQQKIDYLLKVRCYKISDLLQGNILSKSLDFIKFRIDILEKCGIYKQSSVPIHKQNKYDNSGHRNPLLKDILLKSTKDFVKIAKISEEEYLVYEELCKAGNDVNDDFDSDDDKEE